MTSTEWDTLRRNVRNTENELDQRISSYSKLASQLSTGYYSAQASSALKSSTDDARAMESEISEMLESLGKLVDEMTSLLDRRGTSSSSAMNHSLVRHREILQDYNRDFKRTRAQIVENQQRQNLLGSVREEINNFKSGQSSSYSGMSDADMLLGERGRIDESHRMTDEVLEQAYATRREFAQQRSAISSVNARMSGVLTQVPGINSLLSMINSRRRRDSLILSTVAGVCALILLWYVFG
ncbi:28 kda golgi snare protein [Cystobasidium minutum MCA 4210]|uniref:28 kda golgi snare protein n=1 Tax=Cystobasidium minutum MCA 4210 TaxID=1397322 RepID=UPI0034CFF46C|eukprot:jgi/Rhomi1/78884/CE78883_595